MKTMRRMLLAVLLAAQAGCMVFEDTCYFYDEPAGCCEPVPGMAPAAPAQTREPPR